MRPVRTPVLLLTMVFAVLTVGLVPAQPPAPTKYALLVGVNEYDHDGLKKLGYAVNDVTEFKDALEKAGYKVTLLTGKNATKAKVEDALKGLVKKFAKGDTLVVGLAGHGLQFEGDEDSYYCPVDARPFKDKTETLVSVKWVYDRLNKDAAGGPKFLLVDACRNDPKAARGIDADTAPNPPKGVGVLLSCSAGEKSFEHKDFGTGHGAFFHHVIEGFKGKAKDDEGNVTWDSLRAYVKREVTRDVPKVLKEGAFQTPEETGRLAGAPPVLVSRAAELPDGVLSPADAAKKVGETVKVQFVVQSVGGKLNLYLNSTKDFRAKDNFTVLLPVDLQAGMWAKAGPDMFVGKTVRATGKIEVTRSGSVQLEIAEEKALELVKE